MRESLEQTDKVSYHSFLMSLAKHETINQCIGRFNITHCPTTNATATIYKMLCKVHMFKVYNCMITILSTYIHTRIHYLYTSLYTSAVDLGLSFGIEIEDLQLNLHSSAVKPGLLES